MKRTLSQNILHIFCVILITAAAASCSIKEDRWPCPCNLIFKPGEGINLNAPGGFTLTVSNGAGKELSAELSWRQIRDDDYDVAVSKGEKEMNILSGRKDSFLSGTDLLIVKGNQADSIYSSVCHVSCLGEEATVPVEMLKQFSTVYLTLLDGGERLPYYVKVRSFVEGIDLVDLKPVQGEFFFEPEPVNGNGSQFEFRLPRQIPQLAPELLLEIWSKATSLQEEDTLLDRLPLGSLILDAHHDWEKPSLDDIHIGIDYTRAGMKININDWVVDWTESLEI